MTHRLRKDPRKTSGGYIKGLAIEQITKDEYKKAAFQEKQTRLEKHRKELNEFIDFFSEKMRKTHPEAAKMIEITLFNDWRKSGIAKELPQANIQIENLLNDIAMYDALDVAKRIYITFKETRLKK